MAQYTVVVAAAAARQIAALDGSVRGRIVKRIQELKEEARPAGCKKLTGSELWRIRAGDYRIVYSIEDARLLVLVVRVGHRREVYR
jgi:mRNA interferase RelE/StbE